MEFKTVTVRGAGGNIQAGASVKVYEKNTTTPVTTYDEDGNVITNLRTDANGQVGFAAADGVYDIVASTTKALVTVQNQQFFDALAFEAEQDAIEAAEDARNPENVTAFFNSTDTSTAGTIVGTRAEGSAYRAVDTATATTVANAGGQAFEVITPVWNIDAYGADPTGSVAADTQIGKALANIAASGGGVLTGTPGATYQNNTNHTITTQGTSIDMRGATFIGSGRFIWDGDSGTDGDRSSVIVFPQMKNTHFSGSHRGPIMRWVDYPLLENISRDNDTGSFINVQYAKGGSATGCIAKNGEITKIAFLGLHNNNFSFIDCHITGGAWVYGFQIKGGRNNKCVRCSIDGATFTHGFRDRGDAPWGASATTGTYPYSTGSWLSADDQRANRSCAFETCSVTNCTGVPFFGQESIGTIWQDIYCPDASTTCFSITRASGGKEGYYKIIRPHLRDGAGLGVNLTGASVSDQMPGVILDCPEITGFVADDALTATFCDGIKIAEPSINGNTGQNAIKLTDCPNWNVSGAKNCSGNGRGILATIPTLTKPGVASILNCDFSGNTALNVSAQCPVSMRNVTGGPSVQTTDAASNTLIQRVVIPNGKYYAVTITVNYQTESSAGKFTKTAVFRGDASAVTITGSQNVHADINPDTLGGVSLVGSTQMRTSVSGAAATTVDWTISEMTFEEIA